MMDTLEKSQETLRQAILAVNKAERAAKRYDMHKDIFDKLVQANDLLRDVAFQMGAIFSRNSLNAGR